MIASFFPTSLMVLLVLIGLSGTSAQNLGRQKYSPFELCEEFSLNGKLNSAQYGNLVNYQTGGLVNCDDEDTSDFIKEKCLLGFLQGVDASVGLVVDCDIQESVDLMFASVVEIADACVIRNTDDERGQLCLDGGGYIDPNAGLNQNEHPSNERQFTSFANQITEDSCLGQEEYFALVKFFSLGTISEENSVNSQASLISSFVNMTCPICESSPASEECTTCEVSDSKCLQKDANNIDLVFRQATSFVQECFTSGEGLCEFQQDPFINSQSPSASPSFITSLDQCVTTMGIANNINCLDSFVYNGQTYTECIVEDDLRPWCYTDSATDGDDAVWGYCGECYLDSSS